MACVGQWFVLVIGLKYKDDGSILVDCFDMGVQPSLTVWTSFSGAVTHWDKLQSIFTGRSGVNNACTGIFLKWEKALYQTHLFNNDIIYTKWKLSYIIRIFFDTYEQQLNGSWPKQDRIKKKKKFCLIFGQILRSGSGQELCSQIGANAWIKFLFFFSFNLKVQKKDHSQNNYTFHEWRR